MKIKPRASQDELYSPFFIRNQEFCSQFESYIASKGGMVKGDYNAWSYLIYGKFSNESNWNLKYKKSTLTNHGIFLLFSRFKSTVTLVEWKCERKKQLNFEFVIRKKKFLDFIRLHLLISLTELDFSPKYVLKTRGNKTKYLDEIIKNLQALFITKELNKVEFRNDKLLIDLRTDKHHFDILNKLIEL